MEKFLQTLLVLLCINIAATAQPTAGLMAYWRMDGNYVDAGPNFINGTNVGSTATSNNKAVANAAMAFINPGTVSQYATHPVNANLNFGTAQDFTIDFSVYANSPYVNAGGFYDNNLNYYGPGVWFWNANGFPQVQFNFRNASVGTTNGAFALGVWKHIACVRSGANMSIYVNGVLNVTGSVGSQTPVYTYPPRFGTMYYNAPPLTQYNGLNGKLDEMRIYNRALTAIEILQLASYALPVKLTSFSAINNNNNIKLQWQTQYEQNSKNFIIQRSTDGLNFTDIDKVNAIGNSNVPLTYNYTDVLSAILQNSGTVFYRLQSIDIDGQFSNSQVVAVHLNKKDVALLVFPNPVKDVLQVQTNGLTGQAILSITDINGRQLYIRDILLQQGSNSMPINISQFSSGIYYVRVSNGTNNFTKQFAKE